MPLDLTPAERELIDRIPAPDLEELAIELDLLLDQDYDRDAVIERCIVALLERARDEGLPLTRYDAYDLEQLPHEDLRALAELIGARASGRGDVPKVIKACARTVKRYTRDRPRSAVALLLPTLLRPLARAARMDVGR